MTGTVGKIVTHLDGNDAALQLSETPPHTYMRWTMERGDKGKTLFHVAHQRLAEEREPTGRIVPGSLGQHHSLKPLL